MIDNPLPLRFSEKVDFTGDCWLWKAFRNRKGYGQFGCEGKMTKAHRFSWEHFNGDIPDGLWVLHKCDNPACVNPNHLFLGTAQDNMDDMVAKQRSTRGSKSVFAKLTQDQVDEIRSVYIRNARGKLREFNTYGLAKKYGVSGSQIRRILDWERWVPYEGVAQRN